MEETCVTGQLPPLGEEACFRLPLPTSWDPAPGGRPPTDFSQLLPGWAWAGSQNSEPVCVPAGREPSSRHSGPRWTHTTLPSESQLPEGRGRPEKGSGRVLLGRDIWGGMGHICPEAREVSPCGGVTFSRAPRDVWEGFWQAAGAKQAKASGGGLQGTIAQGLVGEDGAGMWGEGWWVARWKAAGKGPRHVRFLFPPQGGPPSPSMHLALPPGPHLARSLQPVELSAVYGALAFTATTL